MTFYQVKAKTESDYAYYVDADSEEQAIVKAEKGNYITSIACGVDSFNVEHVLQVSPLKTVWLKRIIDKQRG